MPNINEIAKDLLKGMPAHWNRKKAVTEFALYISSRYTLVPEEEVKECNAPGSYGLCNLPEGHSGSHKVGAVESNKNAPVKCEPQWSQCNDCFDGMHDKCSGGKCACPLVHKELHTPEVKTHIEPLVIDASGLVTGHAFVACALGDIEKKLNEVINWTREHDDTRNCEPGHHIVFNPQEPVKECKHKWTPGDGSMGFPRECKKCHAVEGAAVPSNKSTEVRIESCKICRREFNVILPHSLCDDCRRTLKALCE